MGMLCKLFFFFAATSFTTCTRSTSCSRASFARSTSGCLTQRSEKKLFFYKQDNFKIHPQDDMRSHLDSDHGDCPLVPLEEVDKGEGTEERCIVQNCQFSSADRYFTPHEI